MIEAELDRLYGVALDRFVAERDELAKRFRAEGEAEDAAAVKALTKPSVPAWAVNQLARERAADVRKLLAAGEELRQAQGRGAGADAFRKATEAERRLVADLTEAAKALLGEAGRPPTTATADRIAATLHAAVADEEARRLLEQGRLTTELEPTGFEAFAGLSPAPAAARDEKVPRRDRAGERKRAQTAKAALVEARDRARDARRTVSDAERELKRARRELEQAEEAVGKAEERLEALDGK